MPMEEEFLESEVMFSDHYDASEPDDGDPITRRSHNQNLSSLGYPTKIIRSMPIHIWRKDSTSRRDNDNGRKARPQAYDDGGGGGDEGGDGFELELDDGRVVSNGDRKMVPPHVIVAKRLAAKMASSVYTASCGRGHHKGRNLCEVRNSILRMTGFLEA